MEVYPTLEEKAAHLLYFVTKNHSFFDGNKRIAAAMFLYFLDKNGALFANGQKTIDDHTLVDEAMRKAEEAYDCANEAYSEAQSAYWAATSNND